MKIRKEEDEIGEDKRRRKWWELILR